MYYSLVQEPEHTCHLLSFAEYGHVYVIQVQLLFGDGCVHCYFLLTRTIWYQIISWQHTKLMCVKYCAVHEWFCGHIQMLCLAISYQQQKHCRGTRLFVCLVWAFSCPETSHRNSPGNVFVVASRFVLFFQGGAFVFVVAVVVAVAAAMRMLCCANAMLMLC